MENEMLYYLMHKDDIVTIITMDTVGGTIIHVAKDSNKDLVPLGGRKSVDDLKTWWRRRAVPINQGNIERLLASISIPSTERYLVKNLGLSLTDHYWIKPVDTDLKWNDVSLYSNEFKDMVGECQLSGKKNASDLLELQEKTIFFPSASTQGELKKKWIIKEQERYLIKGNYGESCQQSANEVIASRIHERQSKMPYVDYQLCSFTVDAMESKILTSSLGCICKAFTNERIEFISAYDVVLSEKKPNDMSEYEHFIQVAVKHGLKEQYVRDFLEYQIVTDFIITNVDRHFNNFGVLRDTETLQFVSMAPIFDSGNSMFWNCPVYPIHHDLKNIKASSFKKRELDLLDYVKNRNLIDYALLPDKNEIEELLLKAGLQKEKIQGIIVGYEKKIKMICEH